MTSTTIDSTGAPLPAADAVVTTGRGRSVSRRILAQRPALIGLAILAFLFTVAVFADIVAVHDPETSVIGVEDPQFAKARAAPCIHALGCPAERPEHVMGLDGNVRDVFARVVFGSRVSLLIGFVTVGGAIVIGMLIGSIAGYTGGWVDNILMRLMDMLLAFPALLLSIVIVTILGAGLVNAMIAVAIVAIPIYARVMRASVLSIREQDYVTAARALGDSPMSILIRRVIPNSLTPMIVQGTLGIGTAVLEVAALSFLGLGALDPTPEWGLMIGREYNNLQNAPHLIFFPGIGLTLTVLGFNLLGDGLRDAFDPRLR
ncbi:MAG: ABC transporter permease [Chloroflexi bacterium]|nr:ABC transporter permease [Chloroflexota bacterium]